jgi:DNA replication protein DnaC
VEIDGDPDYDGMGFLEKVALAVEAETAVRHDRRVARYNKEAGFPNPMACVEDIIYLPNRSLNRDSVNRLADCGYIRDGRNVIITSPTGAGKSYLVQALGNAACRHGHRVRYIRHADFCRQINIARRTDEQYELFDVFEGTDLLIIDDLFLEGSSTANAVDLLEVFTHRADSRSSIMLASQLSPPEWHLRIDTQIIGDALLDRVIHNSYMMEIDGPNMREYCASLSMSDCG